MRLGGAVCGWTVLDFYNIDTRVGLFCGCLIILIVGFRVLGLMCLIRNTSVKRGLARRGGGRR